MNLSEQSLDKELFSYISFQKIVYNLSLKLQITMYNLPLKFMITMYNLLLKLQITM